VVVLTFFRLCISGPDLKLKLVSSMSYSFSFLTAFLIFFGNVDEQQPPVA